MMSARVIRDKGLRQGSTTGALARLLHPRILESLRNPRRPHRRVVPERYGRSRPARRRFGEAQHRREMMQPTDRGIARHRPAVQLRWREFLWHVLQLGLRYLAASDEPAPGLGERHPHKPAAALARAARERHHRAERHQIAGEVVDRRYRIELRPRRGTGEQLALAAGDTADRLYHRVEAATRGPRPDVAEGAQRDKHDA